MIRKKWIAFQRSNGTYTMKKIKENPDKGFAQYVNKKQGEK